MDDGQKDERIERRDDVGNHLKGLLNGGFGLIQGLGLTLKHLFEPPVTLQYLMSAGCRPTGIGAFLCSRSTKRAS